MHFADQQVRRRRYRWPEPDTPAEGAVAICIRRRNRDECRIESAVETGREMAVTPLRHRDEIEPPCPCRGALVRSRMERDHIEVRVHSVGIPVVRRQRGANRDAAQLAGASRQRAAKHGWHRSPHARPDAVAGLHHTHGFLRRAELRCVPHPPAGVRRACCVRHDAPPARTLHHRAHAFAKAPIADEVGPLHGLADQPAAATASYPGTNLRHSAWCPRY